MTDGAPPRSERWYFRRALGLDVEAARTEAEQCIGMNPSGERCRHRMTAAKRLCPRHDLMHRHRISVVDAMTGKIV